MRTLLILLAIVALVTLPLLLHKPLAKFEGSDSEAQALIGTLKPDYKPWFRPVWQPPSQEVSTLLFSLQAAFGAGIIGYYLGLARGRASPRK